MDDPKKLSEEDVKEICEHCELEAQFWEETTELIYAYMVSECGCPLDELELEDQKRLYAETTAKIAEALGMEEVAGDETRECLN